MTLINLIKIGGSLITDKSKPFTVNQPNLEIIAREIAKIHNQGHKIVLGHGAGSFAHVPAHKYQTHLGMNHSQAEFGFGEVSYRARQLNGIVMAALIKNQLPVHAIAPADIMTSDKNQLKTINVQGILSCLERNIVPVLFGDVIFDVSQGSTIFSTERVLAYAGLELRNLGTHIGQIIHCGQTNGVYDSDGQTISLINSQNFLQIKSSLDGSHGVDVTGGMLHKVEETLDLARQGIPGMIIDGIDHGSLSQAVNGQEVIGTKIQA